MSGSPSPVAPRTAGTRRRRSTLTTTRTSPMLGAISLRWSGATLHLSAVLLDTAMMLRARTLSSGLAASTAVSRLDARQGFC